MNRTAQSTAMHGQPARFEAPAQLPDARAMTASMAITVSSQGALRAQPTARAIHKRVSVTARPTGSRTRVMFIAAEKRRAMDTVLATDMENAFATITTTDSTALANVQLPLALMLLHEFWRM